MKIQFLIAILLAALGPQVSVNATVLTAKLPLSFSRFATFKAVTSPADLSIEVSDHKIRAVSLTLPPIALPAPSYLQNNVFTLNGVPGLKFYVDITPRFIASAVVKYRVLNSRRATERQSETKVHSYDGTKEVFYPNDGSASTVISQDLTPYQKTYAGTKNRPASVFASRGTKDSLVIRFQHPATGNLDYFTLATVQSVTLALTPIGKDRWKVRLVATREVSDGDSSHTSYYLGRGTLRGRAVIDSSNFSVNVQHYPFLD